MGIDSAGVITIKCRPADGRRVKPTPTKFDSLFMDDDGTITVKSEFVADEGQMYLFDAFSKDQLQRVTISHSSGLNRRLGRYDVSKWILHEQMTGPVSLTVELSRAG